MKKWMLLWGALALCVLLGRLEEPALTADAGAELTAETKYVALTFDDGPKRGTTDVLLDGLRERGVSATFFLIGSQIAANRDLVARMAAEGHQVGNHTWSHRRLQGAGKAVLEAELGRTDELLTAILGEGDYWVRPPYGQLEEWERTLVDVPLVQWNVDTRDWESRDADKVVAAILEAAEPGSIILLHDIYDTSVEAALRAVDALQREGYWFVTVEELLQLYGVEPQPGALYRSGAGV